jgi:hypothetical protein
MNDNNPSEWEPIKDEEREWKDWDGLHEIFPIEYSTLKKYKGLNLLTTTNFEGKTLYDLTFIKRLLIKNMKLSVLEQRFLSSLSKMLLPFFGLLCTDS